MPVHRFTMVRVCALINLRVGCCTVGIGCRCSLLVYSVRVRHRICSQFRTSIQRLVPIVAVIQGLCELMVLVQAVSDGIGCSSI